MTFHADALNNAAIRIKELEGALREAGAMIANCIPPTPAIDDLLRRIDGLQPLNGLHHPLGESRHQAEAWTAQTPRTDELMKMLLRFCDSMDMETESAMLLVMSAGVGALERELNETLRETTVTAYKKLEAEYAAFRAGSASEERRNGS